MSNSRVGIVKAPSILRGVLFAAIAALVCLAACDRGNARAAPGGNDQLKLRVVATTGMIGDIVREIGGERVSVVTLMGEGVDPHMYKASPGDVRAMGEANVIFYNGLHLEGRMQDALHALSKQRGGGEGVVEVTRAIDRGALRRPPEFEGQYDPHVWFDVSMWRSAAATVASVVAAQLQSRAEEVGSRAKSYDSVLNELDAYAREAVATVPKDQRVLVTAHDAFGYFGRAYGLEVLAIQGISTDSEASLQDINALVDTLVKRRIPAVFVESSVPRKTIDALVEGCKGRGHSVRIGGELFSDAMGRDGTLEGTYVGMVLHNVRTITLALGGRAPEVQSTALRAYVSRFSSRDEGGKTHDH